MQGKHIFALIAVAALLPGPVLAGPPAKKPACQTVKVPPRDARRVDPCRKAAPIPWVVDPTPMFIVSWPELGTPSISVTTSLT